MFWLLSVLLCLDQGIFLDIPFNNRYFLYIWMHVLVKFSEVFSLTEIPFRKYFFQWVLSCTCTIAILLQGNVISVLDLSALFVNFAEFLHFAFRDTLLRFYLVFHEQFCLCLFTNIYILLVNIFFSGSHRTWIHWLLGYRGNSFGNSWRGSEYGRGAKLIFGDVGNRSTAHWAGERQYGTWI